MIYCQGPTRAHLVTTKFSVEKRELGGEASTCLSLKSLGEGECEGCMALVCRTTLSAFIKRYLGQNKCHSFLFPLSFPKRSSVLPSSHNTLLFLAPDFPLSPHPSLQNLFLWASRIADFNNQTESKGGSWIYASVYPCILKVILDRNSHLLCYPCSNRR